MKNSKGYIALSTVLIILVVIIAIVLTTTYTALNEAQSGLALYLGDENLAEVEGCAEEAMLKARTNPAFGDPVETPVNIPRPSPEAACVVTVVSKIVNGSGFDWDMNVSVNTTIHKRTVNVDFTRSPTGITLTSWREI